MFLQLPTLPGSCSAEAGLSTAAVTMKELATTLYGMYPWWSLTTLYLFICQVELKQAIQVFVVMSLVCQVLLFLFAEPCSFLVLMLLDEQC